MALLKACCREDRAAHPAALRLPLLPLLFARPKGRGGSAVAPTVAWRRALTRAADVGMGALAGAARQRARAAARALQKEAEIAGGRCACSKESRAPWAVPGAEVQGGSAAR